MKQLISAADVRAAAENGGALAIDGNTIVTPQAKDEAAELGVELVFGDAAVSAKHKPCAPAECHEVPAAQEADCHGEQKAAVSAEEIERLMRGALDSGIWSERQVEELLGHAVPLTASVGVSGRHVHLSQGDLEALFGAGYELTPIKELSQPGQFAAKETVTLVGPKGVIERVRVLGPVRPSTQVEVLRGDTFKLGVPACVRMSGKLDGTPGVTLAGPHGTVALSQGVIVAARHIHMTCDEASQRGLHDGQVVSIAFGGERGGRLDNVVVRANNTSALDCHIDTEEANAFGIKNGSVVEIVK